YYFFRPGAHTTRAMLSRSFALRICAAYGGDWEVLENSGARVAMVFRSGESLADLAPRAPRFAVAISEESLHVCSRSVLHGHMDLISSGIIAVWIVSIPIRFAIVFKIAVERLWRTYPFLVVWLLLTAVDSTWMLWSWKIDGYPVFLRRSTTI